MRKLLQRRRKPDDSALATLIPPNEAARLAALRRYDVVDTLPEPVFDDLTRLAAHLCAMPVAAITLVDETRLWFKSRIGVVVNEIPRDSGACNLAILTNDLLVIEDTRKDPRLSRGPLVLNEPRVRFYAGMPLRTSDGFNIGTLFVADARARRLSEQQREALRILAHQVMSQLELRRHLVELERSLFEHRRTQDALKTSEVFYQTLVESLPQNILRKDTQGRFVFVNKKFCSSLGRSVEEVLGKTDWDFFPPQLAEKYHRDDLRVIATREPIDTIEANQTPGGERLFVHVIKTPLYDAAGDVVGIQGIFWDVTERKKTEEALAYERDLLRALLENIPDRIYFKDVQSRFLRVSTSMSQRLGAKDPGEVIGKTDFDFYPKPLAEEFYTDEQRIILTGQPLINKLERLVDRDGKESWASVTKVPLKNRSGTVTGIIGISRDVTKLKEAEAALAQARDVALESARLKSEFLANMSHEIRTPMNAIVGMTDLLFDTSLNQEQREFVDTIRSSTDTLLTVISDILDFSKIEAGKLGVESIDFNLRTLVESRAEMVAQRAQSKGIELAHRIASDVPTHLRGDPGRIGQVLTNLLSNAVKFTARGEVVIEVSRVSETDCEAVIRVNVRDTGIGIAQKAMPLIFQAFTQADGSTTRKYGGTGLGLAISKQLIELMRGRLGVESTTGHGSNFWFELPLEKQPEQEAPHELREMPGARVLVVDDNVTSCNVVAEILRRWQLRPVCCHDAASALENLRSAQSKADPFAVAILDLQMPSTDGLTLAQAIKSDSALSGTRLVMLTTLGSRLDPDRMESSGISSCVVKPVKQSRLYDAIANAMHSGVTLLPAGHLTRKVDAPTQDSAVGETLSILIAEDNVVNQRLALRQLQKLGYAARAVSNGFEVLHAIEQQSYDVILMDCQMPEIDGYEVTRRIREFEQHHTARQIRSYIIAVTANALDGDRERCLDAGMDDYITKPVHIAQLEAALNRAGRRKTAPISSEVATILDPSCVAGLKELREPGQPDPVAELVELFNHDAEACIGRIAQAVSARDARTVGQAAHALKGSASNLGAIRLASLCATLEKSAKSEDWPPTMEMAGLLKAELHRVQASLRTELQIG